MMLLRWYRYVLAMRNYATLLAPTVLQQRNTGRHEQVPWLKM
jgi:hypothetical protein